jgi:hypothetical protein
MPALIGTRRAVFYNTPAAVATATTALDPLKKNANITLSGDNLIADCDTTAAWQIALSLAGYSTGKKFCSVLMNTVAADNPEGIGVCTGSQLLGTYMGQGESISWWKAGTIEFNSGTVATIGGFTTGDVLDMAVDLDAKLVWFRKNGGDWNNDVLANQNPDGNVGGASFAGIPAGPYYVGICMIYDYEQYTMNFGATPYTYAAPSGYGNW